MFLAISFAEPVRTQTDTTGVKCTRAHSNGHTRSFSILFSITCGMAIGDEHRMTIILLLLGDDVLSHSAKPSTLLPQKSSTELVLLVPTVSPTNYSGPARAMTMVTITVFRYLSRDQFFLRGARGRLSLRDQNIHTRAVLQLLFTRMRASVGVALRSCGTTHVTPTQMIMSDLRHQRPKGG